MIDCCLALPLWKQTRDEQSICLLFQCHSRRSPAPAAGKQGFGSAATSNLGQHLRTWPRSEEKAHFKFEKKASWHAWKKSERKKRTKRKTHQRVLPLAWNDHECLNSRSCVKNAELSWVAFLCPPEQFFERVSFHSLMIFSPKSPTSPNAFFEPKCVCVPKKRIWLQEFSWVCLFPAKSFVWTNLGTQRSFSLKFSINAFFEPPKKAFGSIQPHNRLLLWRMCGVAQIILCWWESCSPGLQGPENTETHSIPTEPCPFLSAEARCAQDSQCEKEISSVFSTQRKADLFFQR